MTSLKPIAATRLPIAEIDFCAWLGQAVPDDALEYFRGFLALDISCGSRTLGEADRKELARVARRAWWAAEHGLVHLIQRRHGPDEFSYLAVARRRPGPFPALPS